VGESINVLPYVKTNVFQDSYNLLEEFFKHCPTTQARDFEVPVVTGPMGRGKTRLCREVALQIADDLESGKLVTRGKGKTVIITFKLSEWPANIGPGIPPLTSLAYALIFANEGADANVENIHFKHVNERLVRDGIRNVIIHLDEIQVRRDVAKNIVEGCYSTLFPSTEFKVVVVPILSGMISPRYKQVPSHPNCVEKRITALKQPEEITELAASFCSLIGVEKEIFDRSMHLKRLFTLCEGYPNMVRHLASVINEEKRNAGSGDRFSESLMSNLDVSLASEVFRSTLEKLASNYGENRWHAVIRPDSESLIHLGGKTREEARSAISLRDSWKNVTAKVIEWILLVALLGIEVRDDALKVGTTDQNSSVFPTYGKCMEDGLLSLENGVTKMPLMAILYLNQIVKVIPLDVADPFLVDWGNLEVVAAVSLHLTLRFAALRKVTEMQLSEFRKGATYHNCSEIIVQVPGTEDLQIQYFGAKVNGRKNEPINSGKDDNGNPVKFASGLVALTQAGEKGVDALMVLKAKLTKSEKTFEYILSG
jgi:hypothetical protein